MEKMKRHEKFSSYTFLLTFNEKKTFIDIFKVAETKKKKIRLKKIIFDFAN